MGGGVCLQGTRTERGWDIIQGHQRELQLFVLRKAVKEHDNHLQRNEGQERSN